MLNSALVIHTSTRGICTVHVIVKILNGTTPIQFIPQPKILKFLTLNSLKQ